jgi:hypothetical protein
MSIYLEDEILDDDSYYDEFYNDDDDDDEYNGRQALTASLEHYVYNDNKGNDSYSLEALQNMPYLPRINVHSASSSSSSSSSSSKSTKSKIQSIQHNPLLEKQLELLNDLVNQYVKGK